jgi:hypothetical protein
MNQNKRNRSLPAPKQTNNELTQLLNYKSNNVSFLSTYSFHPNTLTTHFLHDPAHSLYKSCQRCQLPSKSPSGPISTSQSPSSPPVKAFSMELLTLHADHPAIHAPCAFTIQMAQGESMAFYGAIRVYIHQGGVTVGGFTSPEGISAEKNNPNDNKYEQIPHVCPPLYINPSNLLNISNPSWHTPATFSIVATQEDTKITILPSDTIFSMQTTWDSLQIDPYNSEQLKTKLKGTSRSQNSQSSHNSDGDQDNSNLQQAISLIPYLREEAVAEASYIYQVISELQNNPYIGKLSHQSYDNGQFISDNDRVVYNETLFQLISSLPLAPNALSKYLNSLTSIPGEDQSEKLSTLLVSPQNQNNSPLSTRLAMFHLYFRLEQIEHFSKSTLRASSLPGFVPLLISRALDQFGKPKQFSLTSCGYKWDQTIQFALNLAKNNISIHDRIDHIVSKLTQFNLNSQTITHQFNPRIHPFKPITFLICGGRNHGKSTFLRHLINYYLSEFPIVAFFETDIGQSECTPGGIISINLFSQPILSPVFSHSQWTPELTSFVGHLGVDKCPKIIFNAIDSVYSQFLSYLMEDINFDKMFQNHKNNHQNSPQNSNFGNKKIPLVVNTCGWTTGFGKTLTSHICSLVRPEMVIEINDKLIPPTFDQLDKINPKQNATKGGNNNKGSVNKHGNEIDLEKTHVVGENGCNIDQTPEIDYSSVESFKDFTIYDEDLNTSDKMLEFLYENLLQISTQFSLLENRKNIEPFFQYSPHCNVLPVSIINGFVPDWLLRSEYTMVEKQSRINDGEKNDKQNDKKKSGQFELYDFDPEPRESVFLCRQSALKGDLNTDNTHFVPTGIDGDEKGEGQSEFENFEENAQIDHENVDNNPNGDILQDIDNIDQQNQQNCPTPRNPLFKLDNTQPFPILPPQDQILAYDLSVPSIFTRENLCWDRIEFFIDFLDQFFAANFTIFQNNISAQQTLFKIQNIIKKFKIRSTNPFVGIISRFSDDFLPKIPVQINSKFQFSLFYQKRNCFIPHNNLNPSQKINAPQFPIIDLSLISAPLQGMYSRWDHSKGPLLPLPTQQNFNAVMSFLDKQNNQNTPQNTPQNKPNHYNVIPFAPTLPIKTVFSVLPQLEPLLPGQSLSNQETRTMALISHLFSNVTYMTFSQNSKTPSPILPLISPPGSSFPQTNSRQSFLSRLQGRVSFATAGTLLAQSIPIYEVSSHQLRFIFAETLAKPVQLNQYGTLQRGYPLNQAILNQINSCVVGLGSKKYLGGRGLKGVHPIGGNSGGNDESNGFESNSVESNCIDVDKVSSKFVAMGLGLIRGYSYLPSFNQRSNVNNSHNDGNNSNIDPNNNPHNNYVNVKFYISTPIPQYLIPTIDTIIILPPETAILPPQLAYNPVSTMPQPYMMPNITQMVHHQSQRSQRSQQTQNVDQPRSKRSNDQDYPADVGDGGTTTGNGKGGTVRFQDVIKETNQQLYINNTTKKPNILGKDKMKSANTLGRGANRK